MSARATRLSADIVAKVGAALAPVLLALVRDTVREELRGAGDADPWIPHPRWPCVSRRAACELARSGALEGVSRVGRGRGTTYLVRRSVLDAWIEAHPVRAIDEDDDGYEREMARRGLVGAATAQQKPPSTHPELREPGRGRRDRHSQATELTMKPRKR
jgi:hypothetical protein